VSATGAAAATAAEDPGISRRRLALVRVASGLAFGLAAVALLAAMAVGREPAWWFLADAGVVAAVVGALGVGFLGVRRARPTGSLQRAWAAGSVVVLLVLGLLIGLD
jgi:hypothetical protein